MNDLIEYKHICETLCDHKNITRDDWVIYARFFKKLQLDVEFVDSLLKLEDELLFSIMDQCLK